MSNEVLKEYLISVGFKVDESSYKRAESAIDKVERKLGENEKNDRQRSEAEQRRHETRKRNAEALSMALGDFAKVAAGAAAVIGGAMVAMAESIRKGIGEFDKMYYVAGRTGASVNNLKALSFAFKQTGSSAEAAIGAVESFARARRANPGVDAMLRGYGVNTQGDTSDVLMNSIDAIRARHPQYAGAQVAVMLGISPDEYDHLTRYRKEIGHFTDEYKRMQAALGVNGGETADAAKEIMRQLGRLSAVVEVLSDKLTQTFAPAIKAVTNALGGIADFFADEGRVKAALAYFDPIIGATKTLVGWLKQAYELFVKMFDYVRASPLGKIIGAVDPGFIRGKILDALQPGGAQASEAAGVPEEKPGLFRRGLNAIKRGLGIGDKADTSPITPGAHPILDLITKAEGTKRGYDDSFAHQVGGTLTDKTLDQIQAIQGGMKGSSAIGKYQFMRKTLNGLRTDLGLTGSELFTPELQDRLAMQLYRRRMAQARREGGGNGAILKALAQEWASLPTASGQGYYPGQNASVSPDAVLRAVTAEENLKNRPAGDSRPIQLPSMQPGRAATSPGTLNLDDLLHSNPMGSSSVNNSKSVSATHGDINVNITGGGSPDAMASSFKRAASDVQRMQLRDVQTAVR
jgi:hypothetical protein